MLGVVVVDIFEGMLCGFEIFFDGKVFDLVNLKKYLDSLGIKYIKSV